MALAGYSHGRTRLHGAADYFLKFSAISREEIILAIHRKHMDDVLRPIPPWQRSHGEIEGRPLYLVCCDSPVIDGLYQGGPWVACPQYRMYVRSHGERIRRYAN